MDWLTQMMGGLSDMGGLGLPAMPPEMPPMMSSGGLPDFMNIPGVGVMPDAGISAPPLGQSLAPQRPTMAPGGLPGPVSPPMPRPNPLRAGPGPGEAMAQGGPGGGMNAQKLLEVLRGIKPPAPADVVKPSTPALPRQAGSIKGGELFALLQALGNVGGGGQLNPMSLRQFIGT